MSDKKVLVLLSNRLESFVNAYLLQKQGFDVIGLSFIIASKENAQLIDSDCNLGEIQAIKNTCDQLKIPFYVSDISDRFKENIVENYLSNRLHLISPPICNLCVKLRIQVLFEKMKELKADHISTGHYCKVQKNLQSSNFYIHCGVDRDNDQSHLLSGLANTFLEKLILPLGDLKKEEVLEIAKRAGIKINSNTLEKCFKNSKTLEGLVNRHIPKSLLKEGIFVKGRSEEVVGNFENQTKYMIGQQLNTNVGNMDKGQYIIGHKASKREIIVGTIEDLYADSVFVDKLESTPLFNSRKNFIAYAKSESLDQRIKCYIVNKTCNKVVVHFDEKSGPFIIGEKIIFYDKPVEGGKILGSGIIKSPFKFKKLHRADRSNDDKEENTDSSFTF